MHGNIPAQAQRAIFPSVKSDTESFGGPETRSNFKDEKIGVRNDSENLPWFAKLARKLWSAKAPAAVEHLSGAPLSTCQRWCRGGSDISGEGLRALIRSTDGKRVVAGIMHGSDAEWWQEYQFALAALPAVEQLRQLQLPLK
jgi:hypothetical protein